MSKIICDVCGTAYPETASQCPICGCAKPEGAQTAADGNNDGGGVAQSYTYVRGGRFSKSNVRKRNRANNRENYREEDRHAPENGGQSSNRGLVIAVVVLLMAILAVVFYIGYQFFWDGPSAGSGSGKETQSTTLPDTTAGTADLKIPCTDLILEDAAVELDGVGRSWLLNVTPEPGDTTDTVTYISSDDSVATVTSEGRVTAVGPGQAVIIITCGDVERECRVVCEFDPEATDAPTDPTDDPTEPTDAPTDPPVSADDYTIHVYYAPSPYYNKETQTLEAMINVGDVFPLSIQDGSGNYVSVTWTPSNSCCTVTGDTVKGVASGSVTLTATYDGITFTCKLIVN